MTRRVGANTSGRRWQYTFEFLRVWRSWDDRGVADAVVWSAWRNVGWRSARSCSAVRFARATWELPDGSAGYLEFRQLDYQVTCSTLEAHRGIGRSGSTLDLHPLADVASAATMEPTPSRSKRSASVAARTTCRVCGSSALAGDGPRRPVHRGAFRSPWHRDMPEPRLPLQLVRCDPMRDDEACGLLQMEYTVPPEVLYRCTGTAPAPTDDARSPERDRDGSWRSWVGSGRASSSSTSAATTARCWAGTATSPASTSSASIPRTSRKRSAKGYVGDQRLLPSASRSQRWVRAEGKDRDVDRDVLRPRRPDRVRRATIARLARADDGIWVSEISYMPTMLEMNSFDTICHEHLEYYWLAV